MIIARIMGGLGNQLFIYAAARALALRTGRGLKLDIINGYSEDAFNRTYLLDHFPIQAVHANPSEVAPYLLHSRSLRHNRKLNRYLPRAWRNYYEERSLYDPHLITLNPKRSHVYLEGYWQQEAYFAAAAHPIRTELAPSIDLAPSIRALANHIDQTSSVCVHVRRRDYAHVLDATYYTRALGHMIKVVPKPVFFVFSDDPQWAKTHILSEAEVIHVEDEHPPFEPLIAFQLMHRCRHHIIANSTFSWWAAWLRGRDGQKVVAPVSWGYRATPAAGWTLIPN